jgi:hypothetical protein
LAFFSSNLSLNGTLYSALSKSVSPFFFDHCDLGLKSLTGGNTQGLGAL